MSGDETIRCPYIVTGLERFFTAEGEAIEVRPAMALCRCHGQLVEDAPQLDAALGAALAFDGPAIVKICSDPELV